MVSCIHHPTLVFHARERHALHKVFLGGEKDDQHGQRRDGCARHQQVPVSPKVVFVTWPPVIIRYFQNQGP